MSFFAYYVLRPGGQVAARHCHGWMMNSLNFPPTNTNHPNTRSAKVFLLLDGPSWSSQVSLSLPVASSNFATLPQNWQRIHLLRRATPLSWLGAKARAGRATVAAPGPPCPEGETKTPGARGSATSCGLQKSFPSKSRGLLMLFALLVA